MPDPVESIRILRVVNANGEQADDVVARETPITIYVNDTELVTLLCTPEDLKDLVVGFLYSEGVITSIDDIAQLSLNDAKGIAWVTLREGVTFSEEEFHRGRAVTSGCAKGQTFAHLTDKLDLPSIDNRHQFELDQIYQYIKQLQTFGKGSSLYDRTGCVHVAVVFGGEDVLTFKEDIGRHNAVDKAVGYCLTQKIECRDKAMMVTGRLSSEMVVKAARLGIPLVISRTAPTSSALKIADEIGMTLIGFARGRRMNIYSHSYRVKIHDHNTD